MLTSALISAILAASLSLHMFRCETLGRAVWRYFPPARIGGIPPQLDDGRASVSRQQRYWRRSQLGEQHASKSLV